MTELVIDVGAHAGPFAEDKDVARTLREEMVLPALQRGQTVVLDFAEAPSATQSFLHALFSSVIRIKGIDVLDQIIFRNTTDDVRALITIVAEYSQEGLSEAR
jgi:hypothetical protein